MALIEQDMKRYAEREWVHSILEPIRVAVIKIEQSVGSVSAKAEDLFTAHNALLQEKQAEDRKKREESSPLGLVKKYVPLFSIVAGLVALLKGIDIVIAWAHIMTR